MINDKVMTSHCTIFNQLYVLKVSICINGDFFDNYRLLRFARNDERDCFISFAMTKEIASSLRGSLLVIASFFRSAAI